MFKVVGFANYLLVVFLNAFTDLGHKIIIQNTIFKTYDGTQQIVLTAIVNALMLLPFILAFSPSAFLADRFNKNIVLKYSALFAIFITLLITFFYYMGWFYTAFAFTFLMALQSALYSPAKYGYVKELVGSKFISAGNGYLQAVTTLAILCGIIFYTVLFEMIVGEFFSTKEEILKAVAPLGFLLVAGSLLEYMLASKLPSTMQKKSLKKFDFSRYTRGFYLKKNLVSLKRKREIFELVIALSLFWSISQVVLAIFGEYAKSNLGITNTIIVQGLMSISVFGIVFGSMLCVALSRYYINMGLSVVGAIGIGIVLFAIPFTNSTALLGFEFAFFGIFSGFILIPINAKIQQLASSVHLGTILAGNNFIQTLFMFSFLMLTTLFAYFGINAEILFFVMGLVAIFLIYMLFRRYFVMSAWVLFEVVLRIRYRFVYVGLEHVALKDSALLLVGNHVSWIDWFAIQLPFEKRVHFIIDKDIYVSKFLNPFFRAAELIPISQRASKDSFFETSMKLKNGKIAAIFPEGEISSKQEVGKFRKGYAYIQKSDALMIPFFIDGIFGSIFSRYKDNKKSSFFRKREITIYFGEAVAHDIKADKLREIVVNLKDKK